METINKITTSKQTTMYDHLCKMIIGNEEVLSRIIKAAVDEANHLNVEEIRRLIKGVHCCLFTRCYFIDCFHK